MNMTLFHQLLNDTVQYLEEYKEQNPYVMISQDLPSLPKPLSVDNTVTLISPRDPVSQKSPLPLKVPTPSQPSIQEPAKAMQEPLPPAPSVASGPATDFVLNPPKMTQQDALQDIRATLMKIAPSLKLLPTIPDDDLAKKSKAPSALSILIPEVPILTKKPEDNPLFHNIAQAIETKFCPSAVIDVMQFEEKNTWEAFFQTPHLKWILIPKRALQECPHLRRYYHEFKHTRETYLGKYPVLLLEDPLLYLKDPSLKRLLWITLCHILSPKTP